DLRARNLPNPPPLLRAGVAYRRSPPAGNRRDQATTEGPTSGSRHRHPARVGGARVRSRQKVTGVAPWPTSFTDPCGNGPSNRSSNGPTRTRSLLSRRRANAKSERNVRLSLLEDPGCPERDGTGHCGRAHPEHLDLRGAAARPVDTRPAALRGTTSG